MVFWVIGSMHDGSHFSKSRTLEAHRLFTHRPKGNNSVGSSNEPENAATWLNVGLSHVQDGNVLCR